MTVRIPDSLRIAALAALVSAAAGVAGVSTHPDHPAPQPSVTALSDTTSHYQPILDGPPGTTSMESGYVILQPGATGSKHSSKRYEEALVILSGEGELVITDGPTLALTPLAVAYCPTWTEHQIRNTGPVPLKYVYVAAQVLE